MSPPDIFFWIIIFLFAVAVAPIFWKTEPETWLSPESHKVPFPYIPFQDTFGIFPDAERSPGRRRGAGYWSIRVSHLTALRISRCIIGCPSASGVCPGAR
jgi:hypothetical protein